MFYSSAARFTNLMVAVCMNSMRLLVCSSILHSWINVTGKAGHVIKPPHIEEVWESDDKAPVILTLGIRWS
jgi:hypothetical protein